MPHRANLSTLIQFPLQWIATATEVFSNTVRPWSRPRPGCLSASLAVSVGMGLADVVAEVTSKSRCAGTSVATAASNNDAFSSLGSACAATIPRALYFASDSLNLRRIKVLTVFPNPGQPRYGTGAIRIARARRFSTIAALCLAALLIAADGAVAQSPCPPTYVLQPGDTLFHITQRCRVKLADLIRANPEIEDLDDLAVGMELTIPNTAVDDGGSGAEGSYMVEPGDTLYSIAQRYDLRLADLINANPGIDADDLQIGSVIALPGADDNQAGEPTISVQPLAGAPGSPVTVSGRHYSPGGTVTIGAGPPESEWSAIKTARVSSDGSVSARVEIPDRARPGGQIVFVIDTEAGRTVVSSRVDVVAERDPDAPPDDPGAGGDIDVQGTISQGVECPIITTHDGRIFSLASEEHLPMGEPVRVEGTLAEASICMQGEGTIKVRAVTEIVPAG
jgi:LysM repeat protein